MPLPDPADVLADGLATGTEVALTAEWPQIGLPASVTTVALFPAEHTSTPAAGDVRMMLRLSSVRRPKVRDSGR
nr:hypothetical protein JVH1_1049 [Rhodococcus sp. JVH1]